MADTVAAVDARVVANSTLCREHVAIEIALSGFPHSEPGQFLHLKCASPSLPTTHALTWPEDGFPSLDACDDAAFLRRPFSIADRWDDEDGTAHVLIIARTVGRGTHWLARLKSGESLNVTGPLGRGFTIPRAACSFALVGGGVGIPPLLYLARRLHESGQRDVTMVIGAATRELLPVRMLGDPAHDGTARACVALPGGAQFPAIVTSDDGSIGLRGLTTDGLRVWNEQRAAGGRAAAVLACGPEPMLRAVAALTREFGVDCQLCIERTMGCGLGTCLSCVVRVRDGSRPDGWRWAQACTDGPVFSRDDLLDYAVPD